MGTISTSLLSDKSTSWRARQNGAYCGRAIVAPNWWSIDKNQISYWISNRKSEIDPFWYFAYATLFVQIATKVDAKCTVVATRNKKDNGRKHVYDFWSG